MMSLTEKSTLIRQGIISRFSSFTHLFLIGGLSFVVVMLIYPLHSWMLDVLLAINIMATLTLLFVALSVGNPMKLSTFPSLLLVATLFRMALNVSSTRLILTTGEAGHIIHTFGEMVTGGNLAVGFVIFVVLTIIQFIVIAKGAERVSEVAARFTLDALPGKQMSIDADLRAGLLTSEEAKTARDNLHRESKLYGSMDGAMKFVKGDAIAGILIVFVNILGGFAVGVLSNGLSLSKALSLYTILTIGDGLVTQIPALIMTITAGFVVTRVADEKNTRSLGADIGREILEKPKTLIGASGLSLVMSCLPGFPFLPFAFIAALLSGAGLLILYIAHKKIQEPMPIESHLELTDDQSIAPAPASAFSVMVSPYLFNLFSKEDRWKNLFGHMLPKMRRYLGQYMGIHFPEVRLIASPQAMGMHHYSLLVYGEEVDQGTLYPDSCLVAGNTEGSSEMNTTHGSRFGLWDLNKIEWLKNQGFNALKPEEMLLRHIAKTLKIHAAEFVGIQEVRHMLDMTEAHYPELVKEVFPRYISLQKLTEVVKRLVEEGIPVKDMRRILETIAVSQPDMKDPVTLTEQVRIGLSRTITQMHANGREIHAVLLDKNVEEEIQSGIQKNGSENYLVLDPANIESIIKQVSEGFDRITPEINKKFVILTQLEIRRHVKKLLDAYFPNITVLSFQELDPRFAICQVGVV
ncbi:type III secretion system export apparatus subunit SctV [bacterium]|nr:type III secretion system export apparatus subunit SctV [bacterium]